MDGIRVGDRFCPLENSPRYGPKRWKLAPLRPQDIAAGVLRLWVEIEMSEAERDFDRMKSALLWADHPTWTRTAPITQDDIDTRDMPQESKDGFAAFPRPLPYPPGKDPESRAARLKTEAEWMANYEKMEAKQESIKLEPKPEENKLAEIALKKIALERGD